MFGKRMEKCNIKSEQLHQSGQIFPSILHQQPTFSISQDHYRDTFCSPSPKCMGSRPSEPNIINLWRVSRRIKP